MWTKCCPFCLGLNVLTGILKLACNFLLMIHHLWSATLPYEIITTQWKSSNVCNEIVIMYANMYGISCMYMNNFCLWILVYSTFAISASPGPRFNIKMSSYQYRKSHCGDKTFVRSSYLHNGISYTGKVTSLYWFSPLQYSYWIHIYG